MAWDTVPAPSYPTGPNPSASFGNALANLIGNYQQSQQTAQQTQQNNLRLQQDQLLLDQSKAFAGGVPRNPDGSLNFSAMLSMLAEKGDINAISSLAPLVQQQQWEQNSAPSTAWGGSSGASPAGGGGEGGTAKGTYSLSDMIKMAGLWLCQRVL
jgi:hypothetical protein